MTQPNGNNGHIFEFGKFVLDPNERILFADGEPIHLTDKVFDTLHLLVRHNGRLLTKEQMMTSIWEESFVEEGNLAKNISRLRKILNGDEATVIETIPRRGYRFAADVKELDGDTSLLVRRNLRLKITETVDEAETEGNGERRIGTGGEGETRVRSRILIVGAAVVVLAVLSGVGFYFLKSDAASPQQAAEGVTRLTNDPADDFYARWVDNDRIRFYRQGADKTGKNMMMNADGTGQTEVQFKDVQTFLHWSPDGSKVIFAKPGDKETRYLANADGSNEIAFPRLGNTDWSADSKKIVYQLSAGEEKNSELFVYSLETGKTENVSNHPGFDADPNFSPDGTQIVFATTRDGNAEIYLMNSDGSNVRRLTNHPAWDSHPVFSPDGTTIAFNADREDENSDVFLMNTEGGDLRRLLDWKSNETVEPGCWSPDGTRIALYSDGAGNDDIYVTSAEVFHPHLVLADEQADLQYPSYSADGGRLAFQAVMPDKTGEVRIYDTESKQSRVLTRTESGDIQPVISPDGLQVVFQNKLGSNTEICLINTDGSGLTNLTQNPARDIGPSFSPDAKKVAFVTNRDGNTAAFRLYAMNIDGSDQQRIYQDEGLIFTSSWSPDGDEMVFVNDPVGRGNFDLFAVSLKNPSAGRQLTHRARSDAYPSISPDGTKIAFASNLDGNWEIYLMNRDGSGQLRVTRNASDDFTPQFSKDGSKLVFSSNRGGKWALYEIDLGS